MSIRTGSRSCAPTQTVTDRSAIHHAPARSGIGDRSPIVSWDEDAALWSACWSASKPVLECVTDEAGRGEAQGLTGPELSASVDVVVDHVPNHQVPTGDRVVGQE